MLERLQELMRQKKSRAFYAARLSDSEGREVTVEEVEELINELRGVKTESVELDIEGVTQKFNFEKGEVEISAYYKKPPTPEQIILDHKIDTTKYKLSAFYSKGKTLGFLVTALFKNISKEEELTDRFAKFLETYKSDYKPIGLQAKDKALSPGALIINKQDAHQNKLDLSGAGNDIFERFEEYETRLAKTVWKASKLVNIENITYIIGSDHFNSEVTGATVKGTVQSNILDYKTSFQLVCDHEVSVIKSLLKASDKVEVIYLVGNHDAAVSFHMASWLKVYFREESRINIDISGEFTKYFSLFDTAICLNHGDVQKPERLAQNFPLEYKEGFGKANHHCILTGDKHTELTRDIGGIKFYQIPAISKFKGSWDKQMGYTTTKAQITSFLIEPGNGVSAILKETL